jgi:hypothetical protein
VLRKRARLQLRMLRDARDMKQVIPSSRTSRIANLKKLPLTERGLKGSSPLPPFGAKVKEEAKSSAAAATATAGHSTCSSRVALAGKASDKNKSVARQTSHASSGNVRQGGGGVGVGIVFAHEAEGGDEVLSVKQFIK